MGDRSVVDLINHFAIAGGALTGPNAMKQAEAPLEACKRMMGQQATAFVSSAMGRPMLLSYSSDGTPCSRAARFGAFGPTGNESFVVAKLPLQPWCSKPSFGSLTTVASVCPGA